MIFAETRLPGAYVIELEKLADERGFFARTWCRDEFRSHGLGVDWVQFNVSGNRRRGTLRGMHYQGAPRQEAKLVRCTMGGIHDVIIDLRPESRAFRQHASVVLTAENGRMLFVPEGLAHGFLTLEDDTEVFYMMSEFYAPELARGVRWNDPAFGIHWPADVEVVSDRDRSYPDFVN